MPAIMIIIVTLGGGYSEGGGAAIDHIEFSSLQACETAKQQIRERQAAVYCVLEDEE